MDTSCGQVFIVPLFPVVDLLLFWYRLWKGSFLFFCRVGTPPRLKTETDPVSETLCFLFVEIRTMDKVQKLSSNDLYVMVADVRVHSLSATGVELHKSRTFLIVWLLPSQTGIKASDEPRAQG
jgi:hypothetical protein